MAEAKDDIVLSIRGMCKSFGRNRVLDHINLDVKRGTVMGLMGENGAGKSTMMKCLFGTYQKDEGKIFLNGKEISFSGPKDALENGIAMVHQELNQCLERSVIDNLFLGRYPVNSMGVVDEGQMKKKAADLFRKLGMTVNLTQPMRNMSVSQRQMCEIAKAISYNSKVIVLDEPTSSLTAPEVEKLFKMMRQLKSQGISLIYISHKMEEIKAISDDITIMRDGKWIATESVKDLTTEQIINMMVGRDLTNRFPPKDNIVKEEILKVEGLTALHQPSIQDVTFELHKGEILGIAGLVGSKRTEIVETIFGMREKASGKITIKGKEVKNHNPNEAIANGFALVTEERRATGIYGMLDINFNSTISNLDRYKGKHPLLALLNDKGMKEDTQWVIDSMHVKTPSQNTSIGGNQQKVILGRWLLTEPDVLMLDEPTRGIDVLAKYEIYQLMIELAKKDKGIIMISSEMPELLGVTDRILVMSNGRVAGIVKTSETTQEEIMTLSAKYL